jgi:hypothetical protein
MRPGKTPSSDPKQLSLTQKVQAMKMRQRAVPGDPKDKGSNVPLDQRLHVQVKLDGNDAAFVLWFRKVNVSFASFKRAIAEAEQNIIVGRAVDLLAAHFKVRPVCATSAWAE